MRLKHEGRESEVLLENGQTITRGETFPVADERGKFLLATQPVPLTEVPERSRRPHPAATGGSSANPSAGHGAPHITREASAGEAQPTEGDTAP